MNEHSDLSQNTPNPKISNISEFSGIENSLENKIKESRIWTNQEDELLVKYADLYGHRNWKGIAEHIPNRNFLQCAARYKRIRPGLVKGSWVNFFFICRVVKKTIS